MPIFIQISVMLSTHSTRLFVQEPTISFKVQTQQPSQQIIVFLCIPLELNTSKFNVLEGPYKNALKSFLIQKYSHFQLALYFNTSQLLIHFNKLLGKQQDIDLELYMVIKCDLTLAMYLILRTRSQIKINAFFWNFITMVVCPFIIRTPSTTRVKTNS